MIERLPLRSSTPIAPGRTFASASQAASYYIGLGFLPVPIPYRSKNPGLNDWEQLRIDATNVNTYFNGEAKNIGVLLGISSLGTLALVDADLDSPEALRVSRAFLPNTNFIFGRNSKPASHWCYFVDPPLRLQQFKDPLTKAMLVELRGTKKDGGIGLQTVLPGSVHETGEPIRFEATHDSTPLQVEGEALVKAVQKVASAALLSRYWPTKGRHVCMLSLAGALARGQWASEDALLFCHSLYQSVPTHDPAALQRVDSEVNDSFAKVAGGEPATGFTALIEHIDKKVVEAALGWLGLKSTTQIATVAGENWREQLLLTKEGNPKAQLQILP